MIILQNPDPLYRQIINKLWDDYVNGGNSMSWLDIEDDAPDTHNDPDAAICYYNDVLKRYSGRYCNHKIQFQSESGLTHLLLAFQFDRAEYR